MAKTLADMEVETRSGLTRAQKRQLGILPRQVLLGAMQLHRDGMITADMTPEQMAFVFMAERIDDPKFGSWWDDIIDALPQILEFLTGLFEIISIFFLV